MDIFFEPVNNFSFQRIVEHIGIAEIRVFRLLLYYDNRIDGCYSECEIVIGSLQIYDDSDHDWSIGGKSGDTTLNT